MDAPKLKRVLYNLLSNAIKFSDSGSRVRVVARSLSHTDSPLGATTLELVVEDQGIGIPDSERHKIFDEFYQIDSGPARRYVGTGLGLALVRRYVELHGGTVAVESTPGVGSTFRVLVPVEPSTLPRAEPES
jgi:signal transduction histidine kinase